MNKKRFAAVTLFVVLSVCLLIDVCTSKGARNEASIQPAAGSVEHLTATPVHSTALSELLPVFGARDMSVGSASSAISSSEAAMILPSPSDSPPTAAPDGSSMLPSPTPTASPTATTTPPPASPDAKTPNKVREVSIPVLNYHSIAEGPTGSTLMLPPDKFARQMEYLTEHNYTPLSITDFMLIMERKKEAPPNPVLLTFDDGYADNYENALPVLKQHGFPATLFMSPGALGQDTYLDWQQVKEMKEAGWDIQPHGMTHPHLPQLSEAKQREEIKEARRQIEEQLGTSGDVFCYPFGEFNKTTLSILKEEGFRYAFTIMQGRTTSSQDRFQLKRIYVNAQDSLSAWSKKLS